MSASVSDVPTTGTFSSRRQIWNAADVIFVSVCDEDRAQLVGAFTNVREVVDDDVDAEHVVVGEHQSAIDCDHVFVRLDDRHVAADLAATAKRNDANERFDRRGRDVVLGQRAPLSFARNA